MRKLFSVAAALMMALGLISAVGAPAQAQLSWTMKDPFAREIVKPGDVDVDPYDIEHVYEVQIRLKRLGLLSATPNGRFGPQTKAAVMLFQKRHDLKATGVVNYRTWQPLIRESIRGRKAVPKACKTAGWHACYDRWHHQVNLYHDGTLHNSWLVRGGDYNMQTRLGNYTVYSRDIDHTSRTYGGAPMPYSQFFSGGEALHGSRYMVNPYEGHSHGCINMYVEDARQLWNLTSTKKLYVHVYGAWD